MLLKRIALAAVIGAFAAPAFAQAPSAVSPQNSADQTWQRVVRDYQVMNEDLARLAIDHTALGNDLAAHEQATKVTAVPAHPAAVVHPPVHARPVNGIPTVSHPGPMSHPAVPHPSFVLPPRAGAGR